MRGEPDRQTANTRGSDGGGGEGMRREREGGRGRRRRMMRDERVRDKAGENNPV